MAVSLLGALSAAVAYIVLAWPLPAQRGCPSTATLLEKPDTGCFERWYAPQGKRRISGVALVVHGLNVRPEMMESLISVLNAAGIEALNISLYGHGDNYQPGRSGSVSEKRQRLDSFKRVTFAAWLEEVRQAYAKVLLRARKKDAPLFFIGYSLGGLLGCSLVTEHTGIHFDKMVLFAPAITLQPAIAYQLKPLERFPDFVIDSDAPPDQRANDGTPVAAYMALLSGSRTFLERCGPKLNIPIIVFVDPLDEFISFSGLRELVGSMGLDRWEIESVSKDNETAPPAAYHMIISEHGVGPASWRRITETLRAFLRAPSSLPRKRKAQPNAQAPFY